MPFKLVSSVSVYEYPKERTGQEINHVVLSRERLLHQGEKIPVKGVMTEDEEARRDWFPADGEIRIINEKTLGIRWKPKKPDLGQTLLYTAFRIEGEPREHYQWEPESVWKISERDNSFELSDIYHSEQLLMKEREATLELDDTYHQIVELPEVFTLVDKARIRPLTKEMLHRVEGPRRVRRKTELVYEP